MENYDEVIGAFGKRVLELRKAQKPKISQEGFALKAGLDRSYYGRVERGEANLTLKQIAAIADALGISIDKLFKQPRRKSS